MSVLKDTRFWMGVAAGFFVGPFVAKVAVGQLRRLKGGQAGG